MNAFLGGLIKVLSRFLIVPMCAICSALTPVIVIRDVDILIGYSGSPALIWDQPYLPNGRDAILGVGEPWMSPRPSNLLSFPRRDQHLSVYTPITAPPPVLYYLPECTLMHMSVSPPSTPHRLAFLLLASQHLARAWQAAGAQQLKFIFLSGTTHSSI